MFLCSQGYW